jgi:hypothetical protein
MVRILTHKFVSKSSTCAWLQLQDRSLHREALASSAANPHALELRISERLGRQDIQRIVTKIGIYYTAELHDACIDRRIRVMIGLRDRDLSVRAVRLEKDVTPTTTTRALG